MDGGWALDVDDDDDDDDSDDDADDVDDEGHHQLNVRAPPVGTKTL